MEERADLTGIARFASAATVAFVALQVLFSCFLFWQNKVFRDYLANDTGTVEIAALDRADALGAPFSFAFTAGVIIVYVINGRWVFLASRNAGIMSPSDDRITPGWAVGWYLVPIMNFFKPYTAMEETWAATVGAQNGSGATTPAWFLLWWMSWVVMNLIDRVVSSVGGSPTQTAEEYLSWNTFTAISGFFWAIPAFFFLRIIKDVTAAQHSYREVFS